MKEIKKEGENEMKEVKKEVKDVKEVKSGCRHGNTNLQLFRS